MRVAVIGGGNIGGTLGRVWARAGHDVVFGLRDPDQRDSENVTGGEPNAQVVAVADCVDGADALLLAIPGASLGDVLKTVGSRAAGMTIIDATNNMAGGPMDGTSAISAAIPDASVFRAFNSLGWENFANPMFDGQPADLFYCGPEGEADAVVNSLISDVGLRPVRVGGLDQVEVIDWVTRLWFALSRSRGRHLAFKVLEG